MLSSFFLLFVKKSYQIYFRIIYIYIRYVLLLIILGSIYLLLTILDSQFKVMNAQSVYVFMIVDEECMFYIVY